MNTNKANKMDAGNGSKAVCRVYHLQRSPSPDPGRSPNLSASRDIMKQLIAVILLLSSLSAPLIADGIPFDRKTNRVTEQHVRLTLSEAQKIERTEHHRITLTAAQHKKLMRLCPACPAFPSVITEVLSHRYGDCTCCVGHPYAIMLPDAASIAIPRSETDYVARYGLRERPVYPVATAQRKRSLWRRFWGRVFRRA